ncbi:Heat shock protein G homolog [hydrothermal vent metagenome]|uniref:Heat shock protein G homolog n=1 Tax=hydrothermal vent metagenome TaxID=652676 RepID=A0A1W1BVM3_9ZZZZ
MPSEMKLQYSHNVIEHLGIKLYQNKPTNVLAELISNAWDAYAENAYINLHKEEYISIFDDGYGMTHDELINNYLIIGKNKRVSQDDNSKLDKKYSRFEKIPNRGPMGRKGIGKLAPFGISKLISLITISLDNEGNNKVSWIELDLDEMIKKENEGEELLTDYKPNIILENVNFNKDEILSKFENNVKYVHNENKKSVETFLTKIKSSGTLLLLNKLTLKRTIGKESLISSMGRRFTVTLLRDDFNVFIDNEKVEEENALPKFAFRIPKEGFSVETIGGKEVRYWVGFVGNAEWSKDEAGVGIYAHGKIAQDRPFGFKHKGDEIFERYMYATVEADWLDELDEDVISTDRTNLNWDADELKEFLEWGDKSVGAWTTEYKMYKKSVIKGEIEGDIQVKTDSNKIPQITQAEQSLMVDMLSDVYIRLGKDDKTKEKLLIATSNAWTHKPMKEMIKKLWDNFKANDMNPHDFTEILDKLTEYSVPESLSLSVTFAQKAYALNLLYKLLHKGREIDLQKLIEAFPWILNPDMEYLSANQTLKTMTIEAINKGLSPSRFQHKLGSEIGVNEGKKPDFVFLSDGAEREFCIIELKHPGEEITLDNREQLHSYMTYIESRYPETKRKGILIGNNTNKIENTNPSKIDFITWDEVFRKSRAIHIEYLTSMLKVSASELGDSRMNDIIHFGGKETIELLQKISENSIEMQELISEFADIEKKLNNYKNFKKCFPK